MHSDVMFEAWSKVRTGTLTRRTFAADEGVEPTNNAAERAVRHAVCWRKTSFGTDWAAGSRFVERMLTAIESCRRQGRDRLNFLVEAIQAHRSGGPPPSLVPAGA